MSGGEGEGKLGRPRGGPSKIISVHKSNVKANSIAKDGQHKDIPSETMEFFLQPLFGAYFKVVKKNEEQFSSQLMFQKVKAQFY